MAKTTVPSAQIRDEDIRIEDLFDFSPEDGGGLNLTVRAGRIRNDNVITNKSQQTVALTLSTTNYVEIDGDGVATANIIGFTSGRIAIAIVGTGVSTITSITDSRTWVAKGTAGGVTGSGTTGTIPKWSSSSALNDSNLLQDSNGVISASKAFASGVVTLTDGATPALDASLGNTFLLTASGDRTIAVPTNPTSGQKIIIRHKASGADRTLALNSGTGGFRFGTDITALTATTSGKTDYIGCSYNAADDKWDVIAYAKGY